MARDLSAGFSSLNPTNTWQALVLFGNRLLRCVAVALVPSAGFLALPKILALHRTGAACLKPSLQHEPWRACYAAGSGETDWLHYTLAIWFTVQFMYNFIMSCFQEPGSPKALPKDGRFRLDSDQLDRPLYFAPRWCESCNQWKPPRSHHSKRLGCCVLRMDHYCIITENIIGQRNQSYFNLMVIFGNLGLLYALLMITWTLWLAWQPYWDLFSMLAGYVRRKRSYYQWLLLGGHLHVLKALLGSEIPLLLVLTIISFLLLLPLLRHLSISLQGKTTLEVMGALNDSIEIPGRSQVFRLEPGDFKPSHFDRRMLLRLLLPIPWFQAELEEEPKIGLRRAVLEELMAILQANKKGLETKRKGESPLRGFFVQMSERQ